MVRGETDIIYRKLYNQYLESMRNPIKYMINPIDDVPSALWVLESYDSGNQGSAFLLKGVGLVTCQHVVNLLHTVAQVLQQVQTLLTMSMTPTM